MRHIEVGALVRCPAEPDWGVGQVQSVVGSRVVVMFEECGKVVFQLDDAAVDVDETLELVSAPRAFGADG